MTERDELLESLTPAEDGIPFSLVVQTIAVMVIVLSFFIPKIYISANIYYKSLEIARLRAIHHSLSEEKIQLDQQLESMAFKNKVIDKL